MTNPFKQEATKEVWYPDELTEPGTVELLSDEPVQASDVPADDARFGKFIKVRTGDDMEVWFACPKDLSRALGEGDATPGHVFQVRSAHREDEDDAPWQFEVAHDPEQH